jgi:hypothetical protein
MGNLVSKFLNFRSGGIIRYNTILQNIAVFFYVALVQRLFSWDFLLDVGHFLLFSLTLVAYGYLVNDWADVDLDARAGKKNVFSEIGRKKALLLLIFLLFIVIAIGAPFARRSGFLSLWIVWWFVTTFYSVAPIRFKERGGFGLVATIAGQQTLPTAMMFSIFGHLFTWGTLVFIAYITMRGICSDLGHQMRDRTRDLAAGANTFVARRKPTTVARLYGLSLEMETLGLGLLLLVLLVDLPDVEVLDWSVALAWPLVICYLFLLPFAIGRAFMGLKRGESVDPYDESIDGAPRDLLHFMHHVFPTILVPLYLACCMTLYFWPNILFLILLAMVYKLYQPARWAGSWPIRILLPQFKQKI